MATTAQPKQRLLEILVGEVSLVDHAANTHKFVVTKRNTEAAMEDVQKAQLDPHTASIVTLNAVRDCLYSVTDKLRDPSKLGEASAEIERIKTMLDNAATLAQEISKSVDAFSELVVKAKDGKKMPPWMKDQMRKLHDTVKAAMDDDDEDEDKAERAEKSITTSVATFKAGKPQLSRERAGKLTAAFKDLGDMVKAADGEGFSKMVAEWAGAAKTENTPAPVTTAPSQSTVSEPPAWFSSAIEGLSKTLKDATAKVESVTKRVETIEKSEAVSKSLPQDGTTNVAKAAEPNIWAGIL